MSTCGLTTLFPAFHYGCYVKQMTPLLRHMEPLCAGPEAKGSVHVDGQVLAQAEEGA